MQFTNTLYYYLQKGMRNNYKITIYEKIKKSNENIKIKHKMYKRMILKNVKPIIYFISVFYFIAQKH
jgi:hypothetical protein